MNTSTIVKASTDPGQVLWDVTALQLQGWRLVKTWAEVVRGRRGWCRCKVYFAELSKENPCPPSEPDELVLDWGPVSEQ